jgi:putative tryptophan/tyrosine transport system substrate-binding protein
MGAQYPLWKMLGFCSKFAVLGGHMLRREFVAGLGSVAAIPPLVAFAEQSDRLRRVDVVLANIGDDPYYEGRLAGLTEAMRGLGWIDGRNLKLVVHRAMPNASDIRRLVTEVLSARPEVVVTGGATTTGPLLQATSSVPVVFTSAVDPVGAGFVESLAQPGGNATGFMQFDFSLSGKWLELLKQVAPAIVRAGVIRDPSTSSGIGQFAVVQSVASSIGVDVVSISARDGADLESGVVKIARSPNVGLITTVAAAVSAHYDLIVKLAARYRLPTVYGSRSYVDRGGLISYGADLIAISRLAAGYVDRILKGEKPADLPVQAPTKYVLVVNLKTAKALGLEIPSTVLARADEVIE